MALIVHKKDLERLEKVIFKTSLPDKVRVGKLLNKKLFALAEPEDDNPPVEESVDRETTKSILGSPVTYFAIHDSNDCGKNYLPRRRRPRRPYLHGWKYCSRCGEYMLTDEIYCPIHGQRLRTSPRDSMKWSKAVMIDPDERLKDKPRHKLFQKRMQLDMITQVSPQARRKNSEHVIREKKFLMDIGVW